MNPDLFPHAERVLVAELGVQQKQLRAIRADELTNGRDWSSVSGEVRYSDAGRLRVYAVLKISAEPSAPPEPPRAPAVPPVEHSAPKNSVEPAPPPADPRPPVATLRGTVETITVHKVYAPNRSILEGKRTCDEIVLIRVRDNRKFKRGMTMSCRFAQGRLWELNQPLPRFPGRW